jgi:hypothetical protein
MKDPIKELYLNFFNKFSNDPLVSSGSFITNGGSG